MASEYAIKLQMCEIGKRIYDRGMVAANDGNISVKIGPDEILCTPTGVSKGFMTPEYICKIDSKGNILHAYEGFRPSSEIKMHLRVYKERPDVMSVVHAHPMYATGFAIAGIPLTEPIMPEAVISLGCVPIAEYGTPSTEEIPDAVAKYLQHYDAVLLENHGALAYSDSLLNAYYKMESLEFYAQLMFISKMLGGPKELSEEQVKTLYALRSKYGLKGKHPADLCPVLAQGKTPCPSCDFSGRDCKTAQAAAAAKTDNDLVAEIAKRVLAQLGK